MKPIFPKLTEREKEVLELIIQGYSNKEICEKLVLAMPTVKCHIQNLYIKHNLYSEQGNTTMRLQLASNYLKKIIIDTKSQNKGLIEQNRELQKELEPFKDDYFKGLDNKTIAELAKKSIRITAENRRLENCMQEIKNVAEVCCSGIECEECPFTDDCKTDSQALGVCRIILKLITKAEEE